MTFLTQLKAFALSLKGYIAGLLFLVFSGLLVLLKLKDSELHQFQVQSMEDKFNEQDKAATKVVEDAKRDYDNS